MEHLGIGQKVVIVVVVIFFLFTIGLAYGVGQTGFNNLTEVKLDELDRTSAILASRIAELERNAVRAARSFEENERIASEIQLLTNLGPYYADPGSYFAEDFMGVVSGLEEYASIEDADQIYIFQAQLNLIQLLQPIQQLNDLSTVSFYLLSPFDIVEDAKPVLGFLLNQEAIYVTQFTHKGYVDNRVVYHIAVEDFRPPVAGYFDISTAYAATAEAFYTEQGFEPVVGRMMDLVPPEILASGDSLPQSRVIVENAISNGTPIIQTWYPVKVAIAHPETWEQELVPVGVVLIEQQLDAAVLGSLKQQLGLDIALAQDGQVLLSTLEGASGTSLTTRLQGRQIIEVAQNDFYYALEPVTFDAQSATPTDAKLDTNLQAMVLSPVSELERLTAALSWRIIQIAAITLLLAGVIVYMSIQYLVSRPLSALMQGVQAVSAYSPPSVPSPPAKGSSPPSSTSGGGTEAGSPLGPLSALGAIRSRDEVGKLAKAFNSMAAQLRDLIVSLERRVAERTQDLERRAVQLQAAADIGRAVVSIRDLDVLLPRVTELIGERFDFYHVRIFLMDSENEYAALRAANSERGQQLLAEGYKLKVGEEGIVGYVISTGEARVAGKADHAPDWSRNELSHSTRTASEVALPLVSGGQLLGALDVQSVEEQAFGKEEVAILQILADEVAVAIDNARLFSETQRALEAERRVYGEVSREAWSKMLRARFELGYLCDSQGVYQCEDAWDSDMVRASQMGRIVQKDGATLVVPLKIRGQTVGALRLRKPDAASQWTTKEVSLVETLAEQLGVALESARLYQDSQLRVASERLSREVTAQIRETLDIHAVLQTAVRAIGEAMGIAEVEVRVGDGQADKRIGERRP